MLSGLIISYFGLQVIENIEDADDASRPWRAATHPSQQVLSEQAVAGAGVYVRVLRVSRGGENYAPPSALEGFVVVVWNGLELRHPGVLWLADPTRMTTIKHHDYLARGDGPERCCKLRARNRRS